MNLALRLSEEPVGTTSSARWPARASLFVLFSYVFLANAWLGDDAYITFRTVWNFVHGYGLTFNPDERVQAYTHPLWMLVVSAGYALTREFALTATLLSWIFGVASVAIIVNWSRTVAHAALTVLWLLSSKAFVDYTASGLEYPLSYLLLTLFYTRYLDRPSGVAFTSVELRWYVFIASLGFLNRPDAVLLYAIPVGVVVLHAARASGRRVLAPVLVGLAPAAVWLCFATLYYGFPLPNTYYAKVANGIPRGLMVQQGMAYLLNSLAHDPLTLGSIAGAVLIAWRSRGAARSAASAIALYVVYTVWVGGDFMSGRFFAMPFLVAVITMAPHLGASATPWAAAALLFYNVLMPIVPLKTTASYEAAWPWRMQSGIRDERGHYHRATNVLQTSPFREWPEFTWVREGLSFRNGAEKVTVQGSIGMFGLYAGPSKFVIDRNALSDPLLARLPVSPQLYFEFYAGHYFRDLPAGYVESCTRNQNLLQDLALRGYYDRLRNVTRGPLLTADRLRDIWQLNVGGLRNFHDAYERRRAIELVIRADNERFITDVGMRDPVKGTLRTTGKAGYLQYGPHIPMKRGRYRARWMGAVDAAPEGRVGFVEVWTGGEQRLERQSVAIGGGDAAGRIAQIDFNLPEGADDLEYRFYVNADVGVTLERVELYSKTALPSDK